MRIVADENIPYVRQAFERLGEVLTVSGRSMTPEAVRDADILLVRSVTPVGEGLIGGSRVRFVGTATIGTDHIDEGFLRGRGIAFAAAPGSNANSVAEYVAAALLVLARRAAARLAGRTIGVIGVGNVGRRVAAMAEALGMQPILNDPPLARATGDHRYRPLEETIEADVVTLHVPLTRGGPDATLHMVDERFLARLKPGAILINTSRGAVHDTAALGRAIEAGRLGGVVLDVWENEPAIDVDLLRRVDLATPHIAGYSFDGKVNGTAMLYEAACRWLGEAGDVAHPPPGVIDAPPRAGAPQAEPADWQPVLPAPPVPRVAVTADGEDGLRQPVLAVYDIERDDAALRQLLTMAEAERGRYFDRLRKDYPVRREFPNATVRAPAGPLRRALAGLGFRLAASEAPA